MYELVSGELRELKDTLMTCFQYAALICLLSLSANAVRASAPQWIPMPLVTQASKLSGITPGGEGAQMIRSLAVSESDPEFLIMGTDVGGIYRTFDGGRFWQVCMVGWEARGGNAFVIDPRNPRRIVGYGCNGSDWNSNWGQSPNGIYLSIDAGASWKHVLKLNEANEWRDKSLAYDASTYNVKLGYTPTAYYESRDQGLYKSVDGGLSWTLVNKDRKGGSLKVHPTKGFVYIADNSKENSGFYKSTDGGATFRKTLSNPVTGVEVIKSHSEYVYLCRGPKVLISTDAGETFHESGAGGGIDSQASLLDVRVSPADPNTMATHHGGVQWWEDYVFYSSDGGNTWAKPRYDHTHAFLPFTQPAMHCVFHPTDPSIVYSVVAGGWSVKSTDGGKTYAWNNNGENAVMQGGTFNISPTNPNHVFLSFQDYNGASTDDGGRTWIYRNPSGNGWGGFEYGGYTADGKVMWSGDAPSWGGPRTLKISRDGGLSWSVVNDAAGKPQVFGGPDVSYSDPKALRILFASNLRSEDGGTTWQTMVNCDAVYTSDPGGSRALYGKHGNKVCRSENHGATWIDITPEVAGEISDIAYDQVRGRLYVASENHIKAWDGGAWMALDTPHDQRGGTHVRSVAVDPGNPAIVYAAGPADIYATSATIVRSSDAGDTWENITVTSPLQNPKQAGGPHEVSCVRVHPITHEAWAAGECFGMWRIAGPEAKTVPSDQKVSQLRSVIR